MAGNLIPVTKSGDQLFIDFKAFRENRLPCTLRIRDQDQESAARVAFMKEPKVARGEAPQTPLCNLNITLPGWSKVRNLADLLTYFVLLKLLLSVLFVFFLLESFILF